MKKNEFIQIKGLGLKELKVKGKTLTDEIVNLVLDKNMKKLKDLKFISKKKKERAQVLTVIRQKELLSELEAKITKPEVVEVEKGGSKEVKTQKLKVKSSSKK